MGIIDQQLKQATTKAGNGIAQIYQQPNSNNNRAIGSSYAIPIVSLL